ncbi:MAG: SAM-dependent methyltransferase [Geobacter sp.]|nr:MAG: SAM-dependent methyltransferase [Geobacter sp.]
MTDQIGFKDHFSVRSDAYTRYRPSYPGELFSWLAGLARQHELAWDCGCGNGQAALGLVPYFERVIATDPSRQQIEHAQQHEGISYGVAPAEGSGIGGNSVDLVMVAQALHWFDFDRFYTEVRRVVRDGGVLAAVSYGPVSVDGVAGEVIDRFYYELIAPYWPAERHYVDEHYATIPFPFPEISAPAFAMEAEWDLEHLLGYFSTWSAVGEYEKRLGSSPLALIDKELRAAWGDPHRLRPISWPLALRVGTVALQT